MDENPVLRSRRKIFKYHAVGTGYRSRKKNKMCLVNLYESLNKTFTEDVIHYNKIT